MTKQVVFFRMMKLLRSSLNFLFHFSNKPFSTYEYAQYKGQEASDLIYSKLIDDKPLMISRFGSPELNVILNYLGTINNFKSYFHYILHHYPSLYWENHTMNNISTYCGFFPSNPAHLKIFSELMLNDMQDVDILGTFQYNEKYFDKLLKKAVRIRLPDIEPYYYKNPWTKALKGKIVLVIHPFEDSIKKQFIKRELLFENKEILPDFQLKTIKAVQTIAGNNDNRFKDWFEALEYMKNEINKTEFDIAIIGCGSYGFPLAAHIKRMGKKAIHMGGATQVMFGIKGKRWEDDPNVACYMNEHWIKPLPHETPEAYTKVEEGCYW